MLFTKRMIIIVLLVLNTIILLGQIWPEGAPPFAHIVNLITLGLNISFLLSMINVRDVHKKRS